MAEISKISGVAIADVAKVDAILKADIANINGLTVPSAAAYLLDTYTGAAAAYSVRRLNSLYTGACMRVRRDSDNTEQDIGFDSNGDLDTAAIATFVGSGNTGFVKTWYDQSQSGGTGSGNDADQTTAASQPQIYNGTAVITENGKPALQFVSDCLANSNSRNVTAYTAYVVGTYSVSGGTTRILTNSPGADYNRFVALYAVNNTTVNTYTDSNNVAAVTTSINTQLLLNFEHTGSVLTNYANGTAGTPYNDATFNFTIPGDSLGNNSGQTFSGMAQECVIYDSDQSSNRSGIETNINNYFSIY